MALLAVPIKGLRQIKQSKMDSRTSLSSPSSSSLIVAVAVLTASAQLMLNSLPLGSIPPCANHSYMKKNNVKEHFIKHKPLISEEWVVSTRDKVSIRSRSKIRSWCDVIGDNFSAKLQIMIWSGITFYDDLIEKSDHFPDHFFLVCHYVKRQLVIIFKKNSRIT